MTSPRDHRCKCGQPLSNHFTVHAYCPKMVNGHALYTNTHGSFSPDTATLAKFPDEYKR